MNPYAQQSARDASSRRKWALYSLVGFFLFVAFFHSSSKTEDQASSLTEVESANAHVISLEKTEIKAPKDIKESKNNSLKGTKTSESSEPEPAKPSKVIQDDSDRTNLKGAQKSEITKDDDGDDHDGGDDGDDEDDMAELEEEKSKSASTSNSEQKKPIKRISLLGERNSGTNWMIGELNRCFNETVLIEKKLSRYKHWFQHEDETTPKAETLVIAQFRDPYYWVEAMRKKPHHASVHMFLEWKEFATKPWTMDRVGLDLEVDPNNVTCQQNFKYHEINSCNEKPFPEGYFTWKQHWSERRPIYEMKHGGSGEPYLNILDMRADKIRNFLDTKNFFNVQDHIVVRYEELVSKGTKFIIEHIEEQLGKKAHCEPTPAQPGRKVRELEPEYIEYITKHMDWEAEALIGYYPKE